MSLEKSKIRCDLCRGRAKLWLHGNDYVGCPQCFETGFVEVIAEKVQRQTRTNFMAGQKPWTIADWNLRSNISGAPVPLLGVRKTT
jgi:hypothetical protein